MSDRLSEIKARYSESCAGFDINDFEWLVDRIDELERANEPIGPLAFAAVDRGWDYEAETLDDFWIGLPKHFEAQSDAARAQADRYRLLSDTQQEVCGQQSRRIVALEAQAQALREALKECAQPDSIHRLDCEVGACDPRCAVGIARKALARTYLSDRTRRTEEAKPYNPTRTPGASAGAERGDLEALPTRTPEAKP